MTLIVAAYLIVFVALDAFSYQFEELRGVVAWYPPTGLTYAFLLTFGVGFGPAVTVALFVDSVFIYRMPQPPALLLLWAITISLIYVAAAAVLRQRIRIDPHLRKLRDVTWLAFTTVFVSALIAGLTVSSSTLSGNLPRGEILRSIFHWWIGETVGVLTVTPFLLVYVMPWVTAFVEGRPVRLTSLRSLPRPRFAVVGQALSIVFVLYWVFGASAPDEFHPLYLISLPLIWIALDRGLERVTAGIVVLNFGVMLVLWFFRLDLAKLSDLQFLLIVNCVVGLLMGAVVTERRRAEEERERYLLQVQEQARDLAQVMRTVPEGVLLLNSAGRIILANPQAEQDLSVLADAHVGEILSHLGDCTLAEVLALPPEIQCREVRGEHRSFEVIARRIGGGLNSDDWVLVLRDVTQEREQQQRALQGERLAAVGQLAAGIAHDFNNILAVIALDARLALGSTEQTTEVHARLSTISGQAQRGAELVRQILDFSRQAVLERRPVALRPFLAEQIAVLSRVMPEKITLELAEGDDNCTVNADPTRLQQVVMNLALNARDAMPGGGDLRFSLERVTAPPSDLQTSTSTDQDTTDWVRWRVTDSGTGIPSEVLPRLFEPFFTTKEPGKGSGLGLAQIHGIVKQHGGEIGVSTQEGVGTTFSLYLPAMTKSCEVEPETAIDETPISAGQTILIVEDNLTLRAALVDTVDLLGYSTLSAANGREALAALSLHGEIDLVMSDLGMPEMGGRELLQEMRRQGITLPMVILSGHPLDDELAGLQALGLAGWLLKPPEVEQLAQCLARAMANERDHAT